MSSSQIPGLPQEGREGPVPEGVADQCPGLVFDDPVVRHRLGPEQRAGKVVLGDRHLVHEVLVLGQLADHRDEFRDVRLDRRADHPVRARFAAETTAPSEASRMDESRPTPHHVVPSAPTHSTYATADAPEPSVSACSE